jgi:hypothetical protein
MMRSLVPHPATFRERRGRLTIFKGWGYELVTDLVIGGMDRKDRRLRRRAIRNDLAAMEELEPTAAWWRRRRPSKEN